MDARRLRLGLTSGMFVLACFACNAEHDAAENAASAAPEDESSDALTIGGFNYSLSDWPSAGHDLLNTRSQPSERRIGPSNASSLSAKWVFQTDGDVWVTPAVAGDALYFPDAAGNLFAVNRKNGTLLWKRKIHEYTGVPNDISRTTPAIVGDLLVFGDQGGRGFAGAYVIAVRRSNGDPVWVSKVEESGSAVITQSPVVYQDTIYVGVSSIEESIAATVSPYKCCSFRGSMLALDRRTGAQRWKTYVIPGSEAPGYAGGAVWGNTPVIDPFRNSIYITTGNNYTVPQPVLDCQALPTPDEIATCVKGVPGWNDNHFDSIMALDMRTGRIKWARAMVPFDSWNISCIFAVPGNETNCTDPKGEDYDFGQGPTLFTTAERGRVRQLLGAGQKSGVYWAVNPDNGNVVWSTKVGPGGSLGGLEWGSATDGKRIYVAVANSGGQPWKLSNGESTISGFWSALDPATGKILWQTAGTPAVKTTNQGPVTVANGVVYAGTIDTAGTMYALEASTGDTLWTFPSGGSVNTSPAVVDSTLYWGSGYGVRGFGLRGNNKLYAFVLKQDCPKQTGCLPPPVAGSGGAAGSAAGGGAAGAAGFAGAAGVAGSAGAAGEAGSGAAGEGGAGEAGSGEAGAGGAAGGGSEPIPTTWSGIYAAYLAPGTIGRCGGCHNGMGGRIVPLTNADEAYRSLQSVGQINGVDSPIGRRGESRLSWLGGNMPPNGPTSAPEAEQAITAWVAAGAPND